MTFRVVFLCWVLAGIGLCGEEVRDSALKEWWQGPGATGDWFGARKTVADEGLTISGKWLGNVFGVVDGGLSRGAYFDQEFKLEGKLDFYKLTGWAGLEGLSAHGGVRYRGGDNVNASVGASPAFNVSSYQGGMGWRLMPFYLTYTTPEAFGVKKLLTISAGWVNPYEVFARQEDAKLFRNNVIVSGKGISSNGVGWSSSYAAWGGFAKVAPVDWFYAQGGVYLAIPGDTDSANHGLELAGARPASSNGWYVVGETGVTPQIAGLPGKYAVGGYYWGLENSGFESGQADGKFGFYIMGEQTLFLESHPADKAVIPQEKKGGGQGLRALGFVNFAPQWNNTMPFFFYSGLVYEGLIPGRDADQLGVALALGNYSESKWQADENRGATNLQTYEGVLEFEYRVQVNRWSFVQPFVQYVIRPGGAGAVSNSTVLGVHFGVIF